jgi:hypothetical protein
MTKPLGMTFHESYGTLPTHLLSLYRRLNASPADHDQLLNVAATPDGTDWNLILELVNLHSSQGYLALPFYL